MKISEFAKKAGVTIKTLIYYDKIGLLKPLKKNNSVYRVYCEKDFLRLEQIATLKFIGLSLKEISKILDETGEKELADIINIQKNALEEKKRHIEFLISALSEVNEQISEKGFWEVEELINIVKITNIKNK